MTPPRSQYTTRTYTQACPPRRRLDSWSNLSQREQRSWQPSCPQNEQPSRCLPLGGVASLLTQPSQPQEALLGNLTPHTLFSQQRWAAEPPSPTPTSAHCPVSWSPLQRPALAQIGKKEGREAALRTLCQQQIRSRLEQKLGAGAGNQEGRSSLSQADGAPRRPSQVPFPSSPLPCSPRCAPHSHRPPLPAARERSGASETFNSVLMS